MSMGSVYYMEARTPPLLFSKISSSLCMLGTYFLHVIYSEAILVTF